MLVMKSPIKFSIIFMLLIVNQLLAQAGNVRELSLQEAVALAAQQNYDILIANSQVAQARGQNLAALSGFLPSISVSENYLRSNDPVAVFSLKLKQGVFTQNDFDLSVLNNPAALDNFATSLQVRQPIFNLDAFYGKSAASLEVEARKESAGRVRQFVSLNVMKAYYGLVLAYQNTSAIQEAVRRAERHRSDAKIAFDQGMVTRADLLAAEVRLAELREELISAKNLQQNASDQLSFLIGLQDAAIFPTDSLAAVTDREPGDSLERLAALRPDLRAFQLRLKASHRNAMMARSGWVPRLNAFGSVEWNASEAFSKDASNWAIGFQLQWQVFDGFGIWGRSRQASAQSEEAAIRFRQASESARLEVRRAQRSLASARGRIRVAESALAQADESLDITGARFQQGLAKTSDLLDREVARTGAKLRLLRARYDLTISQAELRYALGENLEEME